MKEHPWFASIYDRTFALMQARGLDRLRGELLAQAHGSVLELGAGTGLNLPHYGESVNRLVLTEPDPHMARRLRERLAAEPPRAREVEVVEANAEELPFDDGSFDVVVSALVLCTVDDPDQAAAEARRVLVEGGELLLIEHVRSQRPRLARWQDRLEKPWGLIAGGCHPNRDTEQVLASAGFWIDRLERGTIRGALPVMRPMIVGVASRPTLA